MKIVLKRGSPEYRAALSERAKKMWTQPELIERRREAQARKRARDAVRQAGLVLWRSTVDEAFEMVSNGVSIRDAADRLAARHAGEALRVSRLPPAGPRRSWKRVRGEAQNTGVDA